MVQIGDLIIFPFMDLLVIGGRSTSEEHNKGWQGIRDFIGYKIPELRAIQQHVSEKDSGRNRLLSSMLDEVLVSL